VRTCEWVIIGYFAYVLVTAAVLRVQAVRLRYAADLGLLTAGIMALTVALEPAPVASVLRDWLPALYLLFGYWATASLYRGPDVALERRLGWLDRLVFRKVGPAVLRAPRLVLEMLEFAYLLCYPLVPIGVGALYFIGERQRSDAFWTVVLLAACGSYGMLPWLGTRPPRTLGSDAWIDRREVSFRRLNLRVLERGSISVNTFPSGHAASAAAVVIVLATIPGTPWPIFAVVAAGIALGAVTGRYHYLADVMAGLLAGGAAFLLGRLLVGWL
jgi:membrane-associated phospholipid phosphatase